MAKRSQKRRQAPKRPKRRSTRRRRKSQPKRSRPSKRLIRRKSKKLVQRRKKPARNPKRKIKRVKTSKIKVGGKRMAKLRKKTVKRKKAVKKIRRAVKKRVRKSKGDGLAVRYFLNPQFQLLNELRDFILKSTPREMDEMTKKLNKVGRVKLAIATGVFLSRVNPETVATDLFLVADDVDRRKFRLFLNGVEADLGREVRYVIMEKDEFQYRYGMFDRFLRVLLEGPHEKLINRLGI